MEKCVVAVLAQATQRQGGRHLEKVQNIPNELSPEKLEKIWKSYETVISPH